MLSATWFGQMVDSFLAAPPPPNGTRRYSNQQWVVDTMYTFLYDFGQWSLGQLLRRPALAPHPRIRTEQRCCQRVEQLFG